MKGKKATSGKDKNFYPGEKRQTSGLDAPNASPSMQSEGERCNSEKKKP